MKQSITKKTIETLRLELEMPEVEKILIKYFNLQEENTDILFIPAGEYVAVTSKCSAKAFVIIEGQRITESKPQEVETGFSSTKVNGVTKKSRGKHISTVKIFKEIYKTGGFPVDASRLHDLFKENNCTPGSATSRLARLTKEKYLKNIKYGIYSLDWKGQELYNQIKTENNY